MSRSSTDEVKTNPAIFPLTSRLMERLIWPPAKVKKSVVYDHAYLSGLTRLIDSRDQFISIGPSGHQKPVYGNRQQVCFLFRQSAVN